MKVKQGEHKQKLTYVSEFMTCYQENKLNVTLKIIDQLYMLLAVQKQQSDYITECQQILTN